MRAYTKSFNMKKELESFLNDNGIGKDRIVSAFQDLDKTYVLIYYADE